MTLVSVVVGVAFASAALMGLYRIIRGPTILDRMIASDMLLTTIICAVGVLLVYNPRAGTVPVMLVLAATAILGAVVVARYVSRRRDHMSLDTVLDVAEMVCLLLGALLSVAAGVGLIRFPTRSPGCTRRPNRRFSG